MHEPSLSQITIERGCRQGPEEHHHVKEAETRNGHNQGAAANELVGGARTVFHSKTIVPTAKPDGMPEGSPADAGRGSKRAFLPNSSAN